MDTHKTQPKSCQLLLLLLGDDERNWDLTHKIDCVYKRVEPNSSSFFLQLNMPSSTSENEVPKIPDVSLAVSYCPYKRLTSFA